MEEELHSQRGSAAVAACGFDMHVKGEVSHLKRHRFL